MKKKKEKLTIMDLVSQIVNSDLPISTRNEITRHYMLPKIGFTQSILENPTIKVEGIDRPDVEEVKELTNKTLRDGNRETEKLMKNLEEDEEDDDE